MQTALIVICRAVVAHRLRQASLLFQPVIALPFQFADRVGRKELGVTFRFVSSKETAFAPFSQNSNELVCFGSGHAHPWAVEAVRLVHRQQRL
jgi:hypothetical protein